MEGTQVERFVRSRVKAVVAVAVLLLVVRIAYGSILSYRDAVQKQGAAPETTATAPSGEETAGAGPAQGAPKQGGEGSVQDARVVVVLIDGLNLREKPRTDSRVIKRLVLGQRLLLVEDGEGWYRVRDVDGSEGWVAAGGSYTRLEK